MQKQNVVLAVAAVLLAVIATGCRSGPNAEWHVAEWGEARDSLQGARTVQVEPTEITAEPVDDVRPSNWETAWPGESAEQLAQGMTDANGDLTGRTTGNGDLVFQFTATEIYNGDGGGHYMKINPEATVKGHAVVTTPDGQLVVRLDGIGRLVQYDGAESFTYISYYLGEEFQSWIETQR